MIDYCHCQYLLVSRTLLKEELRLDRSRNPCPPQPYRHVPEVLTTAAPPPPRIKTRHYSPLQQIVNLPTQLVLLIRRSSPTELIVAPTSEPPVAAEEPRQSAQVAPAPSTTRTAGRPAAGHTAYRVCAGCSASLQVGRPATDVVTMDVVITLGGELLV